MFSIFHSNKLEILVEHLFEIAFRSCDQSEGAQLTSINISVPNQSIADYVELYFARHVGVSANIRFIELTDWVNSVYSHVASSMQLITQQDNESIGDYIEKIYDFIDLSNLGKHDNIMPSYILNLKWRLFFIFQKIFTIDYLNENSLIFSPFKDIFFDTFSNLNGAEQYRLAKRLSKIFQNYLKYRIHWLQALKEKSFISREIFVHNGCDYTWEGYLWKELTNLWPLESLKHEKEYEQLFENLFLKLHEDISKHTKDSLYSSSKEDLMFKDSYRYCHSAKNKQQKKSCLRLVIFLPIHIPSSILNKLIYLSSLIDIDFLIFNPCAEYWFDLVSNKRLGQLRRCGELDRHEAGHRLLSDWGQATKISLLRINNASETSHSWQGLVSDLGLQSCFVKSASDNLLAELQNSILFLTDQKLSANSTDTLVLNKTHLLPDLSIQFHSCHSMLRQLEVLYDQLIELFQKDESLLASDILIVIPDLIDQVHAINTVFGLTKKIPYKIALSPSGLMMLSKNSLVQIFLDLLLISTKLISIDTLFDWLRNKGFATQYHFDQINLKELKNICKNAGARFVFDIKKNKKYNFQEDLSFKSHFFSDMHQDKIDDISDWLQFSTDRTLRTALERLLLGQVMGEASAPITSKDGKILILPMVLSNIFDEDALNQFRRFHDDLELFYKISSSSFDLLSWCDLCQILIDSFFDRFSLDHQSNNIINILIEVIENIRLESNQALFLDKEYDKNVINDFKINAITMHEIFLDYLDIYDQRSLSSIVSSKVVFCTPEQARFIPYRVIALLNFNEDIWPRQHYHDSYDLMKLSPSFDDFDDRKNDQAIFLDLLLAAREILFISFIGRSVIDNSLMFPSSQVSTLLDYLADQYVSKITFPLQWMKVRENFIIEHPLYEHEACPHFLKNEDAKDNNVVSGLIDYKQHKNLVIGVQDHDFMKMDKNKKHGLIVDLKELVFFWHHPCKYFFKQQLGVDLSNDLNHNLYDNTSEYNGIDVFLEEDFSLVPEARFNLVKRILPIYFSHDDLYRYYSYNNKSIMIEQIMRSMPGLPTGVIGQKACVDTIQCIKSFTQSVIKKMSYGISVIKEKYMPQILQFSLNVSKQKDIFWTTNNLVYQPHEFIIVKGRLNGMLPSGRVIWRYSKFSIIQILHVWIEHLVLNALVQEQPQDWRFVSSLFQDGKINENYNNSYLTNPSITTTTLIFDDVHVIFKPVDYASKHLIKLIYFFQSGCVMPLPFFTKTAFELAKKKISNAKNYFFGSMMTRAENSDPYYTHAFGAELLRDVVLEASKYDESDINHLLFCQNTVEDLSKSIAFLSYEVYVPLLNHLEIVMPAFNFRQDNSDG